jgi:hypothetical protein
VVVNFLSPEEDSKTRGHSQIQYRDITPQRVTVREKMTRVGKPLSHGNLLLVTIGSPDLNILQYKKQSEITRWLGNTKMKHTNYEGHGLNSLINVLQIEEDLHKRNRI